jgi:hypothetical protein
VSLFLLCRGSDTEARRTFARRACTVHRATRGSLPRHAKTARVGNPGPAAQGRSVFSACTARLRSPRFAPLGSGKTLKSCPDTCLVRT